MLIGTCGSFCEIWIKIQQISFKEMILKMQFAKCQPFCLILSMLNLYNFVLICFVLMIKTVPVGLKSPLMSHIFQGSSQVMGYELTHCGLVMPWWHRSGSALAQVMVYCLMAPRHYLNKCWLTIRGGIWDVPDSNFTSSAHELGP